MSQHILRDLGLGETLRCGKMWAKQVEMKSVHKQHRPTTTSTENGPKSLTNTITISFGDTYAECLWFWYWMAKFNSYIQWTLLAAVVCKMHWHCYRPASVHRRLYVCLCVPKLVNTLHHSHGWGRTGIWQDFQWGVSNSNACGIWV